MTVLEVNLGERTVVAHLGDDGSVRIDDSAFTIVRIRDGIYRVSNDTEHWDVAVAGPTDKRWVFVNGQVAQVEVTPAEARTNGSRSMAASRAASHDLSSPMPATVIRVLVRPGTRVLAGDTLLMLEAMKMEVPVRAPRDGVVRAVHCETGDLVQPGVRLLDFE